MKTTFTLISLLIMGLWQSDANAAIGSKLHLNLFNDGNFVVVIDGVRYTNVTGHLDVHNLRAGTHQIRITEIYGRRGRGHGRGNARGRDVLYSGSINIPFRSAVFAHLTQNMALRISEVRSLGGTVQQGPRRGGNYGYGNRGRGNGYGRGANALATTKMQMRAASFDRDRLSIAKRFASTGRPGSTEIAQLMNMLSFDRSKLELAKYAYPFVVDKQNFRRTVSRSFTFDSSVRELDRFIARHTNVPTRRRR